jgi:uncharacterized protein YjiS (DUF1127 family)
MSTYQIETPIGAVYDESGLIASGRTHGFNAYRRARRLFQPVLRLFVRALAEYRTRRAVREMQHLDDRMLRDIGITRESIDSAVRYGREREVSLFAREWTSWATATDPLQR